MTQAPSNLDFEKALMFFHAYMYGPLQGKLRLYRAREIAPTTVASPSDWEVFASILTGDPGTQTQAGVDLRYFEVKSAIEGSSFEYQYHRNSWDEKMERDMVVGHLFFSHRDNLRHVNLYFASGELMAEEFIRRWKAESPYSEPGAQRFRRSVSYGWVAENGSLLMRLENGEVSYPPEAI